MYQERVLTETQERLYAYVLFEEDDFQEIFRLYLNILKNHHHLFDIEDWAEKWPESLNSCDQYSM